MANIETRVKQIVADKLGVDYEDVRNTSSFTNDLGADSLDTVELIMELEKAFNVNIPDDRAEGIATVGDAIAYIEKECCVNAPSYQTPTPPPTPTSRPTPQPRRQDNSGYSSSNRGYSEDDYPTSGGQTSGDNSFDW